MVQILLYMVAPRHPLKTLAHISPRTALTRRPYPPSNQLKQSQQRQHSLVNIYSQTVQPIDGDTAENILIGCTSTTIQSGYWETNTVCVDSTPLATSWAIPTAAPAAPQTAP
ncbi:hypothetical protein ABVK25_010389 [Lepraria finkii]|uniref:Uncharacterized protein n=1 Tax=Lepraria finkii TaxID=1340010 RepID=A0ABR4AUL4_9LECA